MITPIRRENREAFANLAPSELLEELGDRGRYGFGAVKEAGKGNLPVAVLLFDARETEGDAVNIRLRYLYVAPDARGQGVADSLMESLFDLCGEYESFSVVCELPMREEYDGITGFLSGWGFRFDPIELAECTLPLSEIRASGKWGKAGRGPEIPLTDCSPSLYRETLRDLAGRGEFPPEDLRRMENADLNLSFVLCREKKILALFLVYRYGSGILEPILLSAVTPEAVRFLPALLARSLHAADGLPADTPVHIVCRRPEVGQLIDALLPEQIPPIILRGIL